MKLIDKDSGTDSWIAASILKLFEKIDKFTDDELAGLAPLIAEAIKDSRDNFFKKELPILLGDGGAAAFAKAYPDISIGPS
jgi:hypothetical protein